MDLVLSFRRLAEPCRRIAVALLGTAVLAGCSSAPPLTYDLSAVTPATSTRAPRGQIVVSEPAATASLDSDRIVIRTSADQIAYLTGAQWADRLPRLVQTRLVQSFENSHLLRSVGSPNDRIAADYDLASEIRRFEIDLEHGEAVIDLSVKLVTPTGRIAAATIVSTRAPIAGTSGPAATQALDAALGEALRRIVAFAARG